MPSVPAPNDLNADAAPRAWDTVKLEPLEQRLQAAGITTLPPSPDAPEMGDIRVALGNSDPELLTLLTACISRPLSSEAVTKLAGPAERAAKAQALKGAPRAFMSSLNHKNRSQIDRNRFLWIGGGAAAIIAAFFIFYTPSSQATPSAGTAAKAGQVGPGLGAGTAGSGQAGGTTLAGTTAQPAAAGTAVRSASTDPAGVTVAPGGAVSVPLPAQVTATLPAPVSSSGMVTPQVAAAPAPTPYVPQQVTPVPVRGSDARAYTPSSRTGTGTAVPARVPLMALQVPPRAEAPRHLVALSAPLQRANRVVQSVPAEQQGAAVNPARSGVMASSAPATPSRLSSSAGQVPAPVSGLVSQGQASTPQATLTQGMSQQSAPSAGRSGLVAMGSGGEAPARASQGLVSAAGGTGGETALQGKAADSSSGRLGLVSLAPAASSSGMTGQSQNQGMDAPAAAAPQAATVLGGAPAPAVPESPYAMGRQIKAVTDTGALFASVVGNDSAGVINGEDAQLIYATAEDGSVWRGTPRLLTSGRIGVTFARVLIKGQAMKVLADATDGTGLPGVQAESHTDSPKLASELFQSALSGVRSFAQASLQGDSSITSNGTIVSQAAKPNFWVTLGGALAGSLSLPSARITQVNVTSLPKGTQMMLVIRGE